MVFDSWAGELGPREFALFSEPYLAHIAAHLPAKLRSLGLDPVPMTVFPKGAWHALRAEQSWFQRKESLMRRRQEAHMISSNVR
ncbi:hypothetical protein BN1723_016628, partial [Verticillium longisporum]